MAVINSPHLQKIHFLWITIPMNSDNIISTVSEALHSPTWSFQMKNVNGKKKNWDVTWNFDHDAGTFKRTRCNFHHNNLYFVNQPIMTKKTWKGS